jgi:transposase
LAQIARDLDVHPDTLRSWCERVRQQRDHGGDSSQGPIVPARALTLEEENRRLRRENARLTEERDILKKATAFFAKDAR